MLKYCKGASAQLMEYAETSFTKVFGGLAGGCLRTKEKWPKFMALFIQGRQQQIQAIWVGEQQRAWCLLPVVNAYVLTNNVLLCYSEDCFPNHVQADPGAQLSQRS